MSIYESQMKIIVNIIEKFSWALIITTLMSMDFMISFRANLENLIEYCGYLSEKSMIEIQRAIFLLDKLINNYF